MPRVTQHVILQHSLQDLTLQLFKRGQPSLTAVTNQTTIIHDADLKDRRPIQIHIKEVAVP